MKIKVGVFFGGRSVEHEVSIITAIQAIWELDKDKYEVIPIYITKYSEMYTGDALLEIEGYSDISSLLKLCRRVTFINEDSIVKMIDSNTSLFGKKPPVVIDIAFPIVHGANVEDGTLQGYFNTLSLPYVGCDVVSSAVGMNKFASKAVLKSRGITVLDGYTADYHRYCKEKSAVIEEIEGDFNYPIIVKPINLGSSVGISRVDASDELEKALDHAFQFSSKLLIERAITNLREINCSVLGDSEDAIASVCEEPVNSGGFLSYEDKYLNGGKKSGMANTKRLIPAPIPDELTNRIQALAIRTFRALACNGVVRIDFLVDIDSDEENGSVFVNEINTIPGSLAYYLWAASGKPYSVLLDDLIRLALKRQRDTLSIQHSFETNILAGFINNQSSGKYGGGKG